MTRAMFCVGTEFCWHICDAHQEVQARSAVCVLCPDAVQDPPEASSSNAMEHQQQQQQQAAPPAMLVPVYGYPGMPGVAYPMGMALPGGGGPGYMRPLQAMPPAAAAGLAHPSYIGLPNGRLYAQQQHPQQPQAPSVHHQQYKNHHVQAPPPQHHQRPQQPPTPSFSSGMCAISLVVLVLSRASDHLAPVPDNNCGLG